MVGEKKHYPMKESFARPLKDELLSMGIRRNDPRFRDAAQRIGDLRRAAQIDHYVFALLERIEAHEEVPAVYLVDDCRFANEAQVGDLVVRLTTTRANGLSEVEQAHPSETSWQRIETNLNYTTDDPAEIDAIAADVVRRVNALADVAREA
jgi:hypothetical protein